MTLDGRAPRAQTSRGTTPARRAPDLLDALAEHVRLAIAVQRRLHAAGDRVDADVVELGWQQVCRGLDLHAEQLRLFEGGAW